MAKNSDTRIINPDTDQTSIYRFIRDLYTIVRTFPDFPKPGINFYDIMPIFRKQHVLNTVIDLMCQGIGSHDVDQIAAIESRGFLFGVLMARCLGVGFTPLRKPGKLPGPFTGVDYSSEYAGGELQIQNDAILSGDKILLVDDVLATGGTLLNAAKLIKTMGGQIIDIRVFIELKELNGAQKMENLPLHSLLQYGTQE